MSGLLLKDLYSLKKQARLYLIFSGIYLLLDYQTDTTGLFSTLVVVISVMLPITTMAYDERSGWDRFALSTPISRTKLVLSKYILGLVISLGAICLVVLANLFLQKGADTFSFTNVMSLALLYGAAILIYQTLTYPILFKFGVEKGRILIIVITIVPALLISMWPGFFEALENLVALDTLVYIAPVIVIVAYSLSIRVSTAIYKAKEI